MIEAENSVRRLRKWSKEHRLAWSDDDILTAVLQRAAARGCSYDELTLLKQHLKEGWAITQ